MASAAIEPREERFVPLKRGASGLILRGIAAATGGFLLAWAISACGSGSVGAQVHSTTSNGVAQVQSATAASSGKDPATTQDPTTTTVTKTATVTAPAKTVTETKTVTTPGNTTSVTSSTTKVVLLTTATTAGHGENSSLPWWGWVLIALGVAGIVMGVVALSRRGGGHGDPAGPPGS
jgi:hypothetical protein